MRSNPGGYIAPENVIGRDKLIQHIWRALEQQSVALTAIRRIGKTSMLQKMKAEAPPHILPIYRDLEKLDSPLVFVEQTYADVEKYLTSKRKVAKRTRDFIANLAGAEVQGVKLPTVLAPHWKTLLEKVVEDLIEHQERQVIFFWDEIPWMLEKIRQKDGEQAAIEILDTLRALRQTYPNLRMVFTGSVGLHHVIASLKRSGYANAPINDMKMIDVPPLATADARQLAALLLQGDGITTQDPDMLAAAIAEAADDVPFYINHIVDRMVLHAGPITRDTPRAIADAFLRDPQDPWDMSHYRDRIDTYYRPEECLPALALLDVLAIADQPLTADTAFSRLPTALGSAEREQAIRILTLLQRDYYLKMNEEGRYLFSYPLIQRWWRLNRGLTR